MVTIPQEQVEETLKDASDNGTIERGLCIKSQVGKDIYAAFNRFKKRGYFPVGIIIEDGWNMEVLFQRHPKQTKEMKMTEVKTPDELKYKL